MTNSSKMPVNNYYYCATLLIGQQNNRKPERTKRTLHFGGHYCDIYTQVAVESLRTTLTLTLLEMVALNLKPIKFTIQFLAPPYAKTTHHPSRYWCLNIIYPTHENSTVMDYENVLSVGDDITEAKYRFNRIHCWEKPSFFGEFN